MARCYPVELLERFFESGASTLQSHRRCRGGLMSLLKHLASKRGETPGPVVNSGSLPLGLGPWALGLGPWALGHLCLTSRRVLCGRQVVLLCVTPWCFLLLSVH